MKIFKSIIEFLVGTSIIWLPIVASIIVEKLCEIITMNHIMTVVYISIPVLIAILIKMDIDEMKAERRKGDGRKAR
ncbi:MAG: hypothetical protein IJ220_07940 [Clostridia bacterium]|nr:hypothetical protein [Clostridia bacterium]